VTREARACLRPSAALLALALALIASPSTASERLHEVFRNPPPEARPRGYWVWPHGNFDYSTLRQELAAFAEKGLGGVDIFDLGVSDEKDVIPPGPGFMSAEQVDAIGFAVEEAGRLGLEMGLIVSSSWNAGGSWTPAEQASMNLVAWEETVTGPLAYERKLPLPELPDSFEKPYGRFPLFPPRDEDGRPLFIEEVAVLALPLDGDGRLGDPRQARILDDKVDAEGILRVDLPEGRWRVMRLVVTNFGQRLWLPSDRSQGLVMDHFSAEATRAHFGTIIERLEERLGPLEDTALERLYLASYENNTGVIWTPGFEEAFATRMGYRIEPFLPALFGTVIVDEDTTERFLYDYRETASDLFVENLYREGSRICRRHGLLLCSEAGGPGPPLHDVPTEDLKALGAVDVMRGEFWVDKADRRDASGLETLQIVKSIASAAHIYGHRIVEMEAFTSHQSWMEGPGVFKRLADRAFCEGMTRAVYHTMSHNLPEAGRPGWTYQAGSHMSTNLTWWDLSDQLHAYLARASALLQQGRFVADVLYYYGHAIPNFAPPKHARPGLGLGYDYDDLNTEILLRATVNEAGEIVLPSGTRYAVLVLPPDDDRMDLEVLEHVEWLIEGGATVIGSRPGRTYGLRGHPEEERQLLELADRLWGADPPPGLYERAHGRGRLVVGRGEREVLQKMGRGPDVEVRPTAMQSSVDFIHRRTDREHVYFVRNAGDRPLAVEAHFRVPGGRPELWDPSVGTMIPTAVYGQTGTGVSLPLDLPVDGSVFVVFLPDEPSRPHVTEVRHDGRPLFPARAEGPPRFSAVFVEGGDVRLTTPVPGDWELHFSDGRTRTVTVEVPPAPIDVDGPWEVRFPANWGAPPRVTFGTLVSWTESEDPGIRAFSGVATYTTEIDLDSLPVAPDQPVHLDLGDVREVARVYLNGREVGLSSFTPHVLDLTGRLRTGRNTLVVEVANTWLNRLIADDALPENERLTHTNLVHGPRNDRPWRESQPLPSGLLGPVRLVPSTRVLVEVSVS
jgi:hypothetical protein